jgi:hypothetical protein
MKETSRRFSRSVHWTKVSNEKAATFKSQSFEKRFPTRARFEREAAEAKTDSLAETGSFDEFVEKFKRELKLREAKKSSFYETGRGRRRRENFVAVNGAVVELVCSSQNPLDAASKVDLRCCGVFMNKFGKVYEAVKGAEEDCACRTLRVTCASNVASLEALASRIEKLKGSGWKSEVDLDEVRKELTAASKKNSQGRD